MSKVAIQGNASGTGTFTIAAPNSNTDRTLTLPDEAGTVLTSASSIGTDSITVPYFEASITSTQTQSTPGTETVIQYATEVYDSNGWYDTSTYTFTPQIEGLYLITAIADFGENGTNLTRVRLLLNKNGSTELTLGQIWLTTGDMDTADIAGQRIIYMNGSTDNVKITAFTPQSFRIRGTGSAVGQFAGYLIKAL